MTRWDDYAVRRFTLNERTEIETMVKDSLIEGLQAELRVANELIANLYQRIDNLETSTDARIKALYRKFEETK